jgi:hypothetical protein
MARVALPDHGVPWKQLKSRMESLVEAGRGIVDATIRARRRHSDYYQKINF